MKNRSIKALKSLLLTSWLLFLITFFQMVLHIIWQSPLWLILIFIIPITIILIPILTLSSDLIHMKLVTIKGTLVKKYANTMIILMENGELKKFKVFKEDIAEINNLKFYQVIEIEYFRWSRALTAIRKLEGESI